MRRNLFVIILFLAAIIFPAGCKSEHKIISGRVVEYKILSETTGDFLHTSTSTNIVLVLKTKNDVYTCESFNNYREILKAIHVCNKKLTLKIDSRFGYIREVRCWNGG